MPTYVAQLTKLYKEGNESVNSSKLVKKSFSSFEELVNFMLRDKGFKYQEDKRQELKPSSITREEAYMYWQTTGSEEGF
jgi:hypothetical protein